MLTLWSGTSLPVLQRNILTPSSRLEGNNPCKQTLLVAYLLGLVFDLGDEGSMFLSNTSKLLLDCMA
jgi:hypothetical protein